MVGQTDQRIGWQETDKLIGWEKTDPWIGWEETYMLMVGRRELGGLFGGSQFS